MAHDILQAEPNERSQRLHYEFDFEFNFWFDYSSADLLFSFFTIPTVSYGSTVRGSGLHTCKSDLDHSFRLP